LEISDEIHYWGMELPLVFSLEGKKERKLQVDTKYII
jgi:hypothetical protein